FVFATGIRRPFARNVRLLGSWDAAGRYSSTWSEPVPMQAVTLDDGCPGFQASVRFEASEAGKTFQWGVWLDCDQQSNLWGIPTEVNDPASTDRYRSFVLGTQEAQERYDLSHCRRLGAQKRFANGLDNPAIQFAVWAPNALSV